MVAARSLDKSAFNALVVFCKLKLKGIFTHIDHIRVIHTKLGAGYVDLLCGWDGVTKETFKGAGNGRHIVIPVNPTNIQAPSPAPFPLTDELSSLINDIAGAFDISEVSISSYQTPTVHVKVLLSNVLGDKVDTQMFWKVNLSLVQPSRIPFQVRLRSYGFILPTLGSAVKWHLPSLTLHNDRLLLIYKPYPTLSPITLELTSSFIELSDWLGFRKPLKGMGRWEWGFDSEPHIWKWLVEVDKGSPLACSWEKMAKHHVWVMDNWGEAEWTRRQREGERGEARKRSHRDKEGSRLVKGQRLRFPESLDPEVWAQGQPYWPTFNDGGLSIRQANAEANLLPIDPEHPKKLDRRAVDVLQHFGKYAEFEAEMAAKKELAWKMAGKKARAKRDLALALCATSV